MKRRIVKLICLMLTAALFMNVLGGCKKEDKDENVTLNYETIYKNTVKEFSDNPHPVAVIVMKDGKTITFELYEDIAPNTVNNFISLANKGFYDGVIFHRVIDNFMIQTGDPLGTGTGGPGYMIKGEFSNNGHKNDLSHTPGVVSMARQGDDKNPAAYYNTAGSQFFICISEATYLDKNYAAFGKVIEGLENAYAIGKVQTDGKDRPLQEQKIAYVRVDTHGATFDEPVTIPE